MSETIAADGAVKQATPAAGAAARGERLRPRRSSRLYVVLTRLRQAVEALAAELPDGPGTLVDYGCGNTPYRPVFEARGYRYLAADLPGNELATVMMTAEGRVDLPDGAADVVLSTQVLEHVSDPAAYLRECRRLLRPGGRLILSTHGYWCYHPDPMDLWRWTGDGLRKIVEEQALSVERTVGVVGLAGAGLQLFQDAVYRRVWRPLRGVVATVMQPLIALADRLHSDQQRSRESLVLVVVARKEEKAEER